MPSIVPCPPLWCPVHVHPSGACGLISIPTCMDSELIPISSPQHQQQVAAAVERAKQVTMVELNAIMGVRVCV